MNDELTLEQKVMMKIMYKSVETVIAKGFGGKPQETRKQSMNYC